MKMLMRLVLPATPSPGFEAQWQATLQRIGALDNKTHEQGRLRFVMLDIEPGQITPVAEAVFRLAGVKPEFLPEIAAPPCYGIQNY